MISSGKPLPLALAALAFAFALFSLVTQTPTGAMLTAVMSACLMAIILKSTDGDIPKDAIPVYSEESSHTRRRTSNRGGL